MNAGTSPDSQFQEPNASGRSAPEWLVFRPSSIHGFGAFAAVDIPMGTQVIEYLGQRITKAESVKRCEAGNTFIFALDEEYDLDGNVEFNAARFINHACKPNCEAELVGQRIWITPVRAIKAGEEITFNYGYDISDYKEYLCNCGAPGCVGYIVAEEFFGHVRQQTQLGAEARTNGQTDVHA